MEYEVNMHIDKSVLIMLMGLFILIVQLVLIALLSKYGDVTMTSMTRRRYAVIVVNAFCFGAIATAAIINLFIV